MRNYTVTEIDKKFNSKITTRHKINVNNMIDNINNTTNCTIIPIGNIVYNGNTYMFGINVYKGKDSVYFVDANNMFVISNNIVKNAVIDIFDVFETISNIRNILITMALHIKYNISFIF